MRKTYKPMRLRVNVTAFDIHEGVRGQCGHCPVQISVLRTLRRRFGVTLHESSVSVGSDCVNFWLPVWAGTQMLPARAYAFVRTFDRAKHCRADRNAPQPISFWLTLSSEQVAKLKARAAA